MPRQIFYAQFSDGWWGDAGAYTDIDGVPSYQLLPIIKHKGWAYPWGNFYFERNSLQYDTWNYDNTYPEIMAAGAIPEDLRPASDTVLVIPHFGTIADGTDGLSPWSMLVRRDGGIRLIPRDSRPRWPRPGYAYMLWCPTGGLRWSIGTDHDHPTTIDATGYAVDDPTETDGLFTSDDFTLAVHDGICHASGKIRATSTPADGSYDVPFDQLPLEYQPVDPRRCLFPGQRISYFAQGHAPTSRGRYVTWNVGNFTGGARPGVAMEIWPTLPGGAYVSGDENEPPGDRLSWPNGENYRGPNPKRITLTGISEPTWYLGDLNTGVDAFFGHVLETTAGVRPFSTFGDSTPPPAPWREGFFYGLQDNGDYTAVFNEVTDDALQWRVVLRKCVSHAITDLTIGFSSAFGNAYLRVYQAGILYPANPTAVIQYLWPSPFFAGWAEYRDAAPLQFSMGGGFGWFRSPPAAGWHITQIDVAPDPTNADPDVDPYNDPDEYLHQDEVIDLSGVWWPVEWSDDPDVETTVVTPGTVTTGPGDSGVMPHIRTVGS